MLFEAPGGAQEAPGMPPGGSQEAPRRSPGGVQEALKKHEWPVLATLHLQKRPEGKVFVKPLQKYMF